MNVDRNVKCAPHMLIQKSKPCTGEGATYYYFVLATRTEQTLLLLYYFSHIL